LRAFAARAWTRFGKPSSRQNAARCSPLAGCAPQALDRLRVGRGPRSRLGAKPDSVEQEGMVASGSRAASTEPPSSKAWNWSTDATKRACPQPQLITAPMIYSCRSRS
jgi:hypothetical protein